MTFVKGPNRQGGLARRDLVAIAAAAGAAAVAGLYRFSDLFVKHYPPSPYDDVLARLKDREQAMRLGARFQGAFDMPDQAARLRAIFIRTDIASAMGEDIAAGHMVEVAGWVLPQTLAMLAVLSAKI